MSGKRLRIAPSVLILMLFILWNDRTGVSLLTLLAALLHEGGHFLAAWLMRIDMRAMRLNFLGARLEITGRMLSFGEEWLLCAAGPIASLLGAMMAALFWKASPAAEIFSCASLVLGVLNLLPIRSFDGGRMLECALYVWTDARFATAILRGISFTFLFLLWSVAVYFLLRAGEHTRGKRRFSVKIALFCRINPFIFIF